MRVHLNAADFLKVSEGQPRTVLTVGTFDGVHAGHRAVLQQLQEVADRHKATTTLLSFHPHPRTVLLLLAEPKLRGCGLFALWYEHPTGSVNTPGRNVHQHRA